MHNSHNLKWNLLRVMESVKCWNGAQLTAKFMSFAIFSLGLQNYMQTLQKERNVCLSYTYIWICIHTNLKHCQLFETGILKELWHFFNPAEHFGPKVKVTVSRDFTGFLNLFLAPSRFFAFLFSLTGNEALFCRWHYLQVGDWKKIPMLQDLPK